MILRNVLVFAGLAATLGAGTVLAPQAHADEFAPAASCYGSAHSYSKPSGDYTYPSGYLTTTGNCSDINIKPNTDRYVEVCWRAGEGDTCQSEYKLARAGVWTVVATDVLDGTRFFFDFRSTAASTGSWAA
jgi:hypothetical protein